MKNKTLKLALGLSLAGLMGSAQAALIDRGSGLIYDTDRDITWLADANYAQTSGHDADGVMNWSAANAWAAGLVYGGYDDWRLPTSLNTDGTGPCYGYNCTGSEMGHLFYTEGGLSAGQSILASTILDDYFTNMQSDAYWSGTYYSGTEYAGVAWAWLFTTDSGAQYLDNDFDSFYAWAVRPGDVAAAPSNNVPEPATLMLLGLGLAGLGVMRRRG